MPDLTTPYAVPYHCQFASRDLVRAFVHHHQPLSADPLWASYGAATPGEYAHWALRSCGVVCVKMVVDGLAGEASGPVMDWVRAGLALDGYLTAVRPDRPDQRVEYGWKHVALAQLIREAGYEAHLAADLTPDDLAAAVKKGQIVIASVSSQLGEVDTEITRWSGHLVVIWGVAVDKDGKVTEVILHNPSGRTRKLQEAARIPVERFVAGFSGRGIVISRKAEQIRTYAVERQTRGLSPLS